MNSPCKYFNSFQDARAFAETAFDFDGQQAQPAFHMGKWCVIYSYKVSKGAMLRL